MNLIFGISSEHNAGQKRVLRSFFLEQVKYLTLFTLFQVAEYSQWNTILESLKIKKIEL